VPDDHHDNHEHHDDHHHLKAGVKEHRRTARLADVCPRAPVRPERRASA